MCVSVFTLKANEADTRENFSHHAAERKFSQFPYELNTKNSWKYFTIFLLIIYHAIFTMISMQILIPNFWVTCVIDKHKFFP